MSMSMSCCPSLGTSTPIESSRSGNRNFVTASLNAPKAAEPLNLLPNASGHICDFDQPPCEDAQTTGLSSHTVKADRLDSRVLIGNGVNMTVGIIGPCGFNTVHAHPCIAKINVVVQGALGMEFVVENGTPSFSNRLSELQMIDFPQGANHTEFNPGCT